jgi:uncharacterized repeat protein (TIGR03847 family)
VIEHELLHPHHVTVGYTGVPGDRTFFLQAQDEEELLTLQLEKGQAAGIGELLGQLLARVGDAPATDWDRGAMELRPPIEPLWRVGGISLGVDPDEERFALEVEELLLDERGEADDPTAPLSEGDVQEPMEVRIWLDRDLARRLAAHATEVVGQGRPRCELCGRPTESDGSHVCPATNGHGTLQR